MAFEAQQIALSIIHDLRTVVPRVRRSDKHLADQIKRAATSTALLIAEGSKTSDGNGLAKLRLARGSAHETRTALEVATAWGLLESKAHKPIDRKLDSLGAILYTLTR